MQTQKTVIVTGASQGIGAGVANAFLERGYNVVATSRQVSRSRELPDSDRVARVDGDIANPATARNVTEIALARFGTINALVNNAGIFFAKPFVDYTFDDYRKLASTNTEDSFISPSSWSARCWRRDQAAASSASPRRWSIIRSRASMSRSQ